MLTSNEDPTIPENSGVLYVIPQGGGLPTPALATPARIAPSNSSATPTTSTPRAASPKAFS
mgnify:CR=1 FL=1